MQDVGLLGGGIVFPISNVCGYVCATTRREKKNPHFQITFLKSSIFLENIAELH